MARFSAGKDAIVVCALLGAFLMPVAACAEEWPSRPIRLLTPLAAHRPSVATGLEPTTEIPADPPASRANAALAAKENV